MSEKTNRLKWIRLETPSVYLNLKGWRGAYSDAADRVYYAVWAIGVLEGDDPDGRTEVVPFKDQGLIHETATPVNYVNGIPRAAASTGDSSE